ncbi:hypothetical protein R5R35_000200 [Gryllus longicercus]|uniref:Uncharacterized protein n=1 Tax=Gryllus longicercus TaxID=2509291 RepID=A0AAN9ZHG6_9ORTH
MTTASMIPNDNLIPTNDEDSSFQGDLTTIYSQCVDSLCNTTTTTIDQSTKFLYIEVFIGTILSTIFVGLVGFCLYKTKCRRRTENPVVSKCKEQANGTNEDLEMVSFDHGNNNLQGTNGIQNFQNEKSRIVEKKHEVDKD